MNSNMNKKCRNMIRIFRKSYKIKKLNMINIMNKKKKNIILNQ